MDADPEISAMSAVAAALRGLDDPGRERVLDWAAKRYGLAGTDGPRTGQRQADPGQDEDLDEGFNRATASQDADSKFEHFADLYDAVNPSTDVDRALTGGYWFQVVQEQPSFHAQQVNNALKDVGHGLQNVARALTNLQARSPALVRQLSKSGRSQQARKTYKLTTAGINQVNLRLGVPDE